MELVLRASTARTLTRCLVCGFAELRTDEVVDRGVVFLAECPRCEHRFTANSPPGAAPPGPRPGGARLPARAAERAADAA